LQFLPYLCRASFRYQTMPTVSYACALFSLSIALPQIWAWPKWVERTNGECPPWEAAATPESCGSELRPEELEAARAFRDAFRSKSPGDIPSFWRSKKVDNHQLGRKVVQGWISKRWTRDWKVQADVMKVWIAEGYDPASIMRLYKAKEVRFTLS
jgi:hypothetical protein